MLDSEADAAHASGRKGQPARDRWRRARLQVAAARAFAYNVGGFAEVPSEERTKRGHGVQENAQEKAEEHFKPSGLDPSPATTSRTSERDTSPQERGRKRFEGIVVKGYRSWTVALSDLYIAALKAPLLRFCLGIFLIPALLSLLFVPFYLLDLQGFQFDESVLGDQRTALDRLLGRSLGQSIGYGPCHVLLYSLSLSSMFGGSPLQAASRYTLLLANLQTLVAQFTFVFLSGAVFSRMSQRAQPVRCARKAVLKVDDVIEEGRYHGSNERFRVFATRLVLKGPSPCVLVDVRIKLTFRIFVCQSDDSFFCVASDLDLVRPEVAFLQYGLMVRHVIDRSSPLYGHTEESLLAGDASFALTVMGTERASLMSIFHMQEYYISDDDVLWDGAFADLLSVTAKGIRVVDHSLLDAVNVFRAAAHIPRAISRMHNLVRESKSRDAWIRAAQSNAEEHSGAESVLNDEASGRPVQSDVNTETAGQHPSQSDESEDARDQARCEKTAYESDGSGPWDSGKQCENAKSEAAKLMGTTGSQEATSVDPKAGRSQKFGPGLTLEDLQGLRQRKIDKEGPEREASTGDSNRAHRYNAGF